uniref:Genome polyprotein n=1 Tax=Pokeweed mosaic virus TaxID=1220025 RepID=A0A2I6PCS8_9POTV|nr:polyprotein [Pokeweed mosaic virus]
MATILFGSFPVDMAPYMNGVSMSPPPTQYFEIAAIPQTNEEEKVDILEEFSRRVNAERCNRTFMKQKHVMKGRYSQWVNFTKRELREQARKKRDEEIRKIFLSQPDSILTRISIASGPAPSELETQVPPKRPLNRSKRMKHPRTPKPVALAKGCTEALIRCVRKITRTSGIPVEIIGKRAYKISPAKFRNCNISRMHVHHMDGKKRSIDLKIHPRDAEFLDTCMKQFVTKQTVTTNQLHNGDSGLVFLRNNVKGIVSRSRNWFIVRGSHEGKLYDATVRVTDGVRRTMNHYSVAETFWRGFNSWFLKHKATTDHQCESNLPVEDCGAVAALLCQVVNPCGRITCEKCLQQLEDMTTKTFFSLVAERSRTTIEILRTKFPRFKHSIKLMERLMSIEEDNTAFEIFREIRLLIGERNDGVFHHINRLNDLCALGKQADAEQMKAIGVNLLEIARFMKNRTEHTKAGSLQHFRNKISGKAHVNPTLMCDNQLGKNGNFLWGKREYHAKRFFANYFDVIIPSEGYDKFIERVGPNSKRKLAIGNLIVSTNFEKLRVQLEGERIEPESLTSACTSKLDGNFRYPCCCVTLDDGRPVYSDIKMPTKNHLVLGNTGDSKYLDLPADTENKMYIAKQGYCYINIFLAMLVNVDEEQAKDFTKMVRDTIIPALGTWPSMMDVATSCAFLAAFYPDTANAELPRILVDHKNQMMHVIDSFGSLTTGYHVLKANTVTQLTQFASNSLESEMKHYKVGGLSSCQDISHDAALQLLIHGIFRPKFLREILEEEPYLLVMGIVSPNVLLAMYNNGVFEQALQMFLRCDQSLTTMVAILNTLAVKVSGASLVVEQHKIIQSHAGLLMDQIFRGTRPNFSYMTAINYLLVVDARNETDAGLEAIGYRTFFEETREACEKTYIARLEASWAGLSWLEKSYAIWHSRKYLQFGRRLRKFKSSTLSSPVCNVSITQCAGQITQSVKQTGCRIITGGRDGMTKLYSKTMLFCFNRLRKLLPDFLKLLNILLCLSALVAIAQGTASMLNEHKRLKMEIAEKKFKNNEEHLVRFKNYYDFSHPDGTEEDFLEVLKDSSTELYGHYKDVYVTPKPGVVFQDAKSDSRKMEQGIALIALILMVFDTDRSDCVYRTLNKFKGVMSSLYVKPVSFQSIDDIKPTLEEKNMTVDIVLSGDDAVSTNTQEITFEKWWSLQLQRNAVRPHYRTEGKFIEFTRSQAAAIALQIAHADESDFLIRGNVGSGKSTGLPFHLSKKGSVLLIEPTRPLTENVTKQLRHDPFYAKPTIRMRGLSAFGSDPITIMTTGFALHFYANNMDQLKNLDFIIFDECHVTDASAMAFRNLLYEVDYKGKVIKASATPPGREGEFKTQYPVDLRVEDSLSFEEFVMAQGKGTNADVVQRGDNILVYVASYNEVDQLSKLLIERKFHVTKIDGRTMKIGSTEIKTCGTADKKHFLVATNIIENGVTLDIDVVVDFGIKVQPTLDCDNRMISYRKVSISYGERIQRLGRVGRHKPGVALRIGHTEKGIMEIPPIIATEAAFLCFTYGLPVTTQNVSVSLLSQCTVKQARTMVQFELPIFYTQHLVRFDGTMHPAIHSILKRFKLRDSETILNKLSLPYKQTAVWLSGKNYRNLIGTTIPENVKIPFFVKDVPDKMHEEVWEAIQQHKQDAGIGRLTMAQATKVAYTLQTDIHAIPRTLRIIDMLLEAEQTKKNHFESVASQSLSATNFSLSSIMTSLRSHYTRNHTAENIEILQKARAQLLEFANLGHDPSAMELVKNFYYLEAVEFQSQAGVAQALKLKGIWKKSLITRDLLIIFCVFIGGLYMIMLYFYETFHSEVKFEGAKHKNQRLRFRNARDRKLGYEVHADDDTIEHFFGAAYTEKGKKKGKTHGMGKKNRRFTHMYGYDPTDYTFVRFVDPLTGKTLDDSPYTDISLIQQAFGEERIRMIGEDELDPQQIMNSPGLKAYYGNQTTRKALEVDLTPHNPLLVGRNTNSISGFPEREGELRQTGQARPINFDQIPKEDVVAFESLSMLRGVRDYNPIASVICQLTNESEGETTTLHGIGYGPYIITNQHLFKRNNGNLKIVSQHGTFRVHNTCNLPLLPIKGQDVLVMRLPKDFPPFPQRIKFRAPEKGERVCIVMSNFQTKSISSMVSETSHIYPVPNSSFWKHWISTKNGHCGSPIVATRDGAILGIHSIANTDNTGNYFTCFGVEFSEKFDELVANGDWTKGWKFNANTIAWGSLYLKDSVPDETFRITKLIQDLVGGNEVCLQATTQSKKWMYDALEDNLRPMATMDGKLVTKHTVKGKCSLFATYLQVDQQAQQFFTPLMGSYKPSRLNKEAYIKDLMKYSSVIDIGLVDCEAFERAERKLYQRLVEWGFETCDYINDEESILTSLNMKAAVGALYQGKKRDYFQGMDNQSVADLIKASCKRLFLGKLGIWNGSLKAELRPDEKVSQNKTRTFTAAPLDTLLGGKVCVDDFNNQFYSLNLKCPWSVGMTKFYGGWNSLMTQLPDGWLYCDADGSQFDSSLSPYLINAVLNLRLSFMEDWELGERMLKNLYTEIVYTPIATPDGTIVKKFKGNNSGQPSTVVDNTLMVILAMYYSFEIHDLSEHDCVFFVNGDDLLIAIKPEKEKFLDGLSETFKTLGLKYDFSSRTRNREDLWFMSHRAIKREGIYIPKLEPERIVSILEWDRSSEPTHRLEAICAAMIESWGYDQLTHEIRRFYKWVLEQAPYAQLAQEGKAPYLAESALRNLYLDKTPTESELQQYISCFYEDESTDERIEVHFQSDVNAGVERPSRQRDQPSSSQQIQQQQAAPPTPQQRDSDVNVGTRGTFSVPRLKGSISKMSLPKLRGQPIVNLDHLLGYDPEQTSISNAKATQNQLSVWYDTVKASYDVDDEAMKILLNGLMVWCIENGTSPNINGSWVMMEGDEQIEYPLKPIVENAKPTLRQIMMHFSDLAEAYIEKRNLKEKYMPRYGLIRNLTDMTLARYAFDFYEVTSKTPARAREAHMQMKAAALRNASTKMFGLDGNVGTKEENTERHTAEDVSREMHNLMGVRMV